MNQLYCLFSPLQERGEDGKIHLDSGDDYGTTLCIYGDSRYIGDMDFISNSALKEQRYTVGERYSTNFEIGDFGKLFDLGSVGVEQLTIFSLTL